MGKLFTSESVTEGHPDKIADQISDAILDALLEQDPYSRVAAETTVATGIALVVGEITTKAYVDIAKIARDTIEEIGYVNNVDGYNSKSIAVLTSIDEQSADIALGVDKSYESKLDGKDYYTISMQHYVFAVHSFVNAIARRNAEVFSYLIKETRTDEVLSTVKDYKSEIGVLAYSESNKKVMQKLLREYELEFHPLMVCDTYAYLSKSHLLADKKEADHASF